GLPPDSPARRHVERALAQGDVLTAAEYLDLSARGEPVSDLDEVRDVFDEFFPDRLATLEAFLADLPAPQLAATFRGRGALAGEPLEPLGDSGDQAAQTVERWFGARRGLALKADAAMALLGHLGFLVTGCTQVTPVDRRGWQTFELTTRPLEDRELCPVPFYGSQA